AKGKSVVCQEEGTFEQIVRFLLRSNKPLLSKHENSAQKARDAAVKLASKKAAGKRAHEDHDDNLDNNGEGTSEKKPRKKLSSAKSTSPKDTPAAQTVKYGGITWHLLISSGHGWCDGEVLWRGVRGRCSREVLWRSMMRWC
ncbi:hypothetical protein HDU78_011368, partial [Chytriomyces hyalinus]